MFDFFRKNKVPVGPHVFSAETEIACSPDALFSLINLHDSGFWKRQMGDRVEEVAPGRFEMVISQLPDVRFTLSVTDCEPGKHIGFEAVSEPRMGRLDRSIELYEVTEVEPGLTRLELSMTVYFQKELRMKAFEEESLMMTVSTFNTVEKIRLFAEQGANAVKVADEQLIVGLDEIACNKS